MKPLKDREPWELTFDQFCRREWESLDPEYRHIYKTEMPDAWENRKNGDLLKLWQDTLFNRADVGSIPRTVMLDYERRFGTQDLLWQFRGRREKGLAEWQETHRRKLTKAQPKIYSLMKQRKRKKETVKT